MPERKIAFSPIIGGQPRLLILGSMPGEASLQCQQYYGHPRNAFWPIMTSWLGLPSEADYARCAAALVAHGIALWDVIAECARCGSLDARIRAETVRVNDFEVFFAQHPSLVSIVFNGGTAEREYRRRVYPALSPAHQLLAARRLPSTSPAYAALSLSQKTQAWHDALAELLSPARLCNARDRSARESQSAAQLIEQAHL